MDETCLLIDAIKKDQLRKQGAEEFEILNREKRTEKKKEGTSKPSLKKGCLANKTTRKNLATSNTSNSKFNADIPQFS